MQTIDIPVDELHEAPWNPNVMDDAMLSRLRESLQRFDLVENLVVREVEETCYEVLNGNQRLRVLREGGWGQVPCVVVDVDDSRARLLSQALNRIQGEDDLGLKAEVLRQVLKDLSEDEVVAVLPETSQSLEALSSLGQEDIAHYLQNWQQAQTARLRHLQFQLTSGQLETVEEALNDRLPEAREERRDSPNARGTALYLLCRSYLENRSTS